MQLIADEVENSHYIDLVLSPEEMKRISAGDMINGEIIIKRRKYYLGVRLRGSWDYEETDESTE